MPPNHAVEKVLNRIAVLAFPAILIVVSLVIGFSQLVHMDPARGTQLPLRAWEQRQSSGSVALEEVTRHLSSTSPQASLETKLSTDKFWISVKADAPGKDEAWAVGFPSRHAMAVRCWDTKSLAELGSADRSSESGQLVRRLGGFAVTMPASASQADLLCESTYRGPAKISSELWSARALAQAESSHQMTGTMIEAGLGVLALSMLLMAIINRSVLYFSFVGWVLLNMRMAALSAGTDFDFFGVAIPADWLVLTRQWTVSIYGAMTVALFSQLFADEISKFRGRIALTLTQFGAIFLVFSSAILSFEQMLPLLWILATGGIGVMLVYLYRILRYYRSAVAVWYACSSFITLTASLNEVLAAAIGQRNLISGLNSVTAALASGLLVSAAAAEHMRIGRKQKEAAQKTLKAAYDDSPIGLFTLREGDQIVNSNSAFRSMLEPAHLRELTDLSHIFDAKVVRQIRGMRDGPFPSNLELQTRVAVPRSNKAQDFWFAIKLSTNDGEVIEGSLQDISEKVRATNRLEFLVNHDPLTECLNLRGLSRQFDRSNTEAKALAYFDLDRFKLINDLYGHSAGDAVLKQVCARMRTQLGPDDLLARVGGDEFVIAFPNASLAEARQCCESICALLASAPYQIGTQRFALSVSAGLVATEHFGNASLKEIVSAADTLCRMAKKHPTERLFVTESGNTFFKHHKDELELISCLERGETPKGLFLLMQPEISLHRPFDSLNFEVLLRMRKPNGDIVPAPVIIEAAEAHGKTTIIDMWVMKTVIAWLETHADQLPLTRFVGVNLSGGSLNDEAFVEDLFALFKEHEAIMPLLCLEITETVVLTDMRHVQRFIDRVRAIGAKVSLDDFGAGYSSFGYLKGLSVDALKLDGSLVRDAAKHPASMAIVAALAGLATNLGMKSVGEFAEDLPTIKALVAAGVDYAQGYGISRPVLPERILAAHSGADFIEDREILDFVRRLQDQTDTGAPLFVESAHMRMDELLH